LKKNWYLSVGAGALSIFGAGLSTASAQTAGQSADQATTVEDVVVTASRREEKLQDVPIAVQALSGDKLQELGITDFQKLLLFLPDVHAAGRGPGQNTVYIRGLSTDTASILIGGSAGTNPNVAIYLDDVAVSMPVRNLDVYAADLERVEVLKGPQGSLFGASAMGGAIRYITAKPNLSDFSSGFSASYAVTKSGDDSVSGQGFVNIPIIKDKLAVRLVVYNDSKGGYIDNIPATYQMPLTSPGFRGRPGFANIARPIVNNATNVEKNFNSADYRGLRVAVAYQINDDWSVGVQHVTQTLKTEGVFDYDPTLPDLQVKRFNPDNLTDNGDISAWTLKGRLGQLELLYTGGYINRRAVQNTDYTNYSSSGPFAVYYNCDYAAYVHAYGGSAVLPATAACHNPKNHVFNQTRNTRFTEEFRIATPAENRLRAIGGLYYDKDHVYSQDHFAYEGSLQSGFPSQNRPLSNVRAIDRNITDPTVQFINDITRSNRQMAIFGEVSYDIIPEKLTLTAGGRYYDQRVTIAGGASFGSRFNQNGDNGRPVEGPLFTPRTEKGFIPKINLTYKPMEDVLVYATYSEGFRPGGFNRGGGTPGAAGSSFRVPVSYGTDTVKNYEIGWKTQFFNNSLQLNGAAYYIKWDNIQSQVYRPKDSFLTFVQNAADAEIRGLEASMIWRGISGLTVNAALTYLDSELTRVTTGVSNLRPVGSRLALTPDLQGNIGVRYEWTVAGDATAFVRGNMQAAGRMLSTIDRGADAFGNPLSNDYQLDAYQTFDASVGVSKDNWNVELFGDNLSDERAQLYANASDRVLRITTNRPRTFGVRVSAKY
jgi:iron complex outermembrane recepter protein